VTAEGTRRAHVPAVSGLGFRPPGCGPKPVRFFLPQDGGILSGHELGSRSQRSLSRLLPGSSEYADQNDLARSFGYSTRTLRRFQERLHSRGLSALARPEGRPVDGSIPKPTPRDRTILRLKAQGISNRGIAGRLGLDEKVIRKILRRLGWQPALEATLPLLPQADAPAKPVTISDSSVDQISLPAPPPPPPQREEPVSKQAAQSFDRNPLDLWPSRAVLLWPARRIREHGHVFGFLYVDGHVRAYHGKHTIPKADVTRARLAAPRPPIIG
jgi:prepilin-type processing-associated H-X9-DG protein